MPDTLYFAIGDIHGELSRLKELHSKARAYAADQFPALELVFIHLGDLIDRGEDSCGVIQYIMDLHSRYPESVHTLRGNHEDMMLEARETGDWSADDMWLKAGGHETMVSYLENGYDEPPEAHLDWLANLPDIIEVSHRDLIFVHAGVHPVNYPDCDEQVHMWSRKKTFFDTSQWLAEGLRNKTVVHGHTPTRDHAPDWHMTDGKMRINVDTGAVYGGVLTGVGLAPEHPPFYLSC